MAKTYQTTPSRRRICKPLIRKNFQSFSSECSQNMFTKQAMVKTVSRSVKQEIAAVCSDKFPSVFKKSAGWFTVITEVHSRATTLFSLLRSVLRNKTSRINEGMIIVVIAGIIFKHRRSCSSWYSRWFLWSCMLDMHQSK